MTLAPFFLAMIAFGSASASLPSYFYRPPDFPRIRSLDDCSFMPKLPTILPPLPPTVEDVCALHECPRAPGQCYQDSECISYTGEAVCTQHEPKAFGASCYDGGKRDAVCGGDGSCRGLDFRCPADINIFPNKNHHLGDSDRVTVNWDEPDMEYHGKLFAVFRSHYSGDKFEVGSHTVTYEIDGDFGNGIIVERKCSFSVKVFASRDPCSEVECSVENVCQKKSRCEVEGVKAVCKTDSVQDGTYAAKKLYRAQGKQVPRADILDNWNKHRNGVPDRLSCFKGESWCEGTLRFLPKRLPGAPPHAPFPKMPEVQTTVPAPPRRITTRRTTTRAPATTTPKRQRTTNAPSAPTRRRRDLLAAESSEQNVQENTFQGYFLSNSAFVVLVVGVMCLTVGGGAYLLAGKSKRGSVLPYN